MGALVRCKNCHQMFDNCSYGHVENDFCSTACQDEYYKKNMMQSAMIGAAVAMKRQAEAEERRQKQIDAAQQTAIQAQNEAKFAAEPKAATASFLVLASVG